MRAAFCAALAILCCVAASTRSAAQGVLPPQIQSITVDLEGDGTPERVVLDVRRDPTLSVWRGRKLLHRDVPQRWKPWKLAIADVDGNGRKEIVLGVHKGTRFFPQPHNCLFVFNWDGQKTSPKWLGSSLSKPFSDFTFANFDNDRALELLSVETRPDGKKCLVCYSYLDFGFGVDWQRGAWKTLRILSTSNNRVLVEADGKQMNISRLRKPVS
jgi:hypothetical protein